MPERAVRVVRSGGCRLALAILLVLSAGRLSAQDAAGIIGQLTDESGAVLPGVTVAASSPALQVQQITAVTDEHGEYRLTLRDPFSDTAAADV